MWLIFPKVKTVSYRHHQTICVQCLSHFMSYCYTPFKTDLHTLCSCFLFGSLKSPREHIWNSFVRGYWNDWIMAWPRRTQKTTLFIPGWVVSVTERPKCSFSVDESWPSAWDYNSATSKMVTSQHQPLVNNSFWMPKSAV